MIERRYRVLRLFGALIRLSVLLPPFLGLVLAGLALEAACRACFRWARVVERAARVDDARALLRDVGARDAS